jgi:hypothetical protein
LIERIATASWTVPSSVVILASVPKCHDCDDENAIGDRVDDAVVADPNAQAGSAL